MPLYSVTSVHAHRAYNNVMLTVQRTSSGIVVCPSAAKLCTVTQQLVWAWHMLIDKDEMGVLQKERARFLVNVPTDPSA